MSTNTPNLVTIKVTPSARAWLMQRKAEKGDAVHKTVDNLISSEQANGEIPQKIRITKCSNVGWWYGEMIGRVFEVTERRENNYAIDYPGNNVDGLVYYVLFSDCEPVIERRKDETP